MRRTISAPSLIAVCTPLVLTEFVLLVTAFIEIATERQREYKALHVVSEIALATIVGLSLVYISRRTWAILLGGIVSAGWLYLGVWILHDVRVDPEKWSHGDGAEAVILLFPLGAIGVLGSAVLLIRRWRERRRLVTIED